MYTPEVVDEYCRRLADGELAIEISQLDGMPSTSTIWRWQEEHDGFRETYARARRLQAYACAEKAVQSGRNATAADAAAARVRFDADRWLAARLDPSNWADRTVQEVVGKDGGPIQHEDVRAPIASKILPKVYGERVTQEVVGRNDGPIQYEDVRAPIASLIKAKGE
jgi:terminase small subunit-like protein